MQTLLYPTYFPSISHYVAKVNAINVCFEVEDNFQKQTNRNRMYIYSPNGVQLLNVPIKHCKSKHQKTKDVKIEYDFDWQKQHFKSLEAAYRTSPFFEFFEDNLEPIFTKKTTFLIDLNFITIEFINKALKLSLSNTKTVEYFHEVENCVDFRSLVNGKKDLSKFDTYQQVFQYKYNFLNNLSTLDLLFNEGKYALDYLKNQNL